MANLDKDLNQKPLIKKQFAFHHEKVIKHKPQFWYKLLKKIYRKKKIKFDSFLNTNNKDPYNLLNHTKKPLSESSSLYAGLWVASFLLMGFVDSGFNWGTDPTVLSATVDKPQMITNQAHNAAINLLTYEATSPENIALTSPLFYQDGFSRWEQYAKNNSLISPELANNGDFLPELNDSTITDITGKHGMTYYHTLTPIKVHYLFNEQDITIEKQLLLTLVENPEKHNEFLIDDAKIREK